MAEIINTGELTPQSVAKMTMFNRDQVYNCLDTCVTFEVWEAMQRLGNRPPEVYDFERALQAPVLEMMLRGCAVDQAERAKAIMDLEQIVRHAESVLQRFAVAVWSKPLNPNSPKQLKEFFYGALHLPEIWTSKKGQRMLSMDRETLEKLQKHWIAMPVISAILTLREHERSLKVLQTEIDPDGRIRTSYNIAATETGRFSSSKNAFGTGGNLQNWKQRLRKVFHADQGWKIGAIDKEQAESRELGFTMGVLFRDWTYLNAAESGDLHTYSSTLIWPEMPWTGDPKADRALADQIFYLDFTYRDMSKRGGHGTNYLGTPFTMARHLKVPTKVMELFQDRYFGAFPSIPRLHLWVAEELQRTQRLCTYFGRERHFFGRPDEDATLREAIAYMGQSPTADCTNLGLYKLWRDLRKEIRLLWQLHDAVYFLYREKDEMEIMPRALKLMEVEVFAPSGRRFVVPGEAKVGWNMANAHDKSKPLDQRKNPFNPLGLVKWKGKRDERERK